jgi:hypothetical protein
MVLDINVKWKKLFLKHFKAYLAVKARFDRTTENVVLSPKSCLEMLVTGAFKDKQIKCDGLTCKYTAKFETRK